LFAGANIDAFDAASKMGFEKENVAKISNDAAG
jgi:hypothetical protein